MKSKAVAYCGAVGCVNTVIFEFSRNDLSNKLYVYRTLRETHWEYPLANELFEEYTFSKYFHFIRCPNHSINPLIITLRLDTEIL